MKKLALVASLLIAAGTAGAQQHTMKLSTSTSGDALVEWLNTFAKGVNLSSGGKVKAEVYPASQLGPIPRTVEGVALGTIEMSLNASGFYEGLEPRFAVLNTPGLFDSLQHAYAVIHDPEIQRRVASFGSGKGVEALTLIVPSQYAILSHKAVNRLDDLKGQKIRVPGSPIQIEALKRLGANPLSMPFGEIVPALQNRTIDGVYVGTTLFTALKFYDIAKPMTLLPSHWATTVPLVNRNFMKSLGPDLEKIVRAEAASGRRTAASTSSCRRPTPGASSASRSPRPCRCSPRRRRQKRTTRRSTRRRSATARSSLAALRAEGRPVRRRGLVARGDGGVEVAQQAVLEAVDPAVHVQLLAARPGVLHDGGLAHVRHLLDDVQLAQAVLRAGPVLVAHVLHVPQPVVDQAVALVVQRGAHPAAAVVAADDDVAHLEDVDGELHHRQAVEVGVDHDVGHVPVHEQLAGQQVDDLVGGHAAVRAADPQVARRLLPGEAGEELRVPRADARGPGTILLEKGG
jgi:TRAP-type C4-dicarboxylate transport system substrate-binding protein